MFITPWFYDLPVEIAEDEQNVYVRVAMPGVSKDSLDITIDKNVVRIKGSLNKHNKNVYYSEFTYGSFERVIKLPYEVKLLSPEEYKVTYQDGVLEIQLPKAIEQRGVRIKFSEA